MKKNNLSKKTSNSLFSLKQIEKIISGTDDFIFLLDVRSLSLEAVNDSGLAFLSDEKNALIGKNFFDLLPPFINYTTQKQAHLPTIFENFKKSKRKKILLLQQLKSGATYECALDTVKVSANHHYLFVKMRDISQRNNNKEQTVQFIHTIGHELKQPLSLIKAYSYYIKRNLIDKQEKLKQYPEKIDQQVDILTSMLNDIADTTKLSNKQIVINKEPTEINELVSAVLTDIRAAYPSRHFVLHTSKPTLLFADPLRLRQAVMNLCMNSVKYSEDHSTITISIVSSKHTITLQIADQGIGIPKEEYKKIFDPYFRSSISRKRSTKGLGLGLALVKEIVTLHKGRISVESTLGKSSTFTLEFPLK